MRSIRSAIVVLCVSALEFGCGPTYYRVTDPTTSRQYYTTGMKKMEAGSVQLRDAGTGRTVTLQNTEVQTVTKEEFETGKVRSTLVRPDPPNPPAPIGAAAIEGIGWQLVDIGGQPAAPIPADERPAGFRLDATGKRVNGYGGVNQLSGPFEMNGKELRFGELAMTRRAGSEPLMRQESELSRAMEQTVSWRTAGQDEIELLDSSGRPLARFRRQPE